MSPKLAMVEVVMCVVASHSLEGELGMELFPKGELQMEPFSKGGRLGHLGPIEIGLTTCKEDQVHLGDEGMEFSNLGVLKLGSVEASNIAKPQSNVTSSFGMGKGVIKGFIHWEKR